MEEGKGRRVHCTDEAQRVGLLGCVDGALGVVVPSGGCGEASCVPTGGARGSRVGEKCGTGGKAGVGSEMNRCRSAALSRTRLDAAQRSAGTERCAAPMRPAFFKNMHRHSGERENGPTGSSARRHLHSPRCWAVLATGSGRPLLLPLMSVLVRSVLWELHHRVARYALLFSVPYMPRSCYKPHHRGLLDSLAVS